MEKILKYRSWRLTHYPTFLDSGYVKVNDRFGFEQIKQSLIERRDLDEARGGVYLEADEPPVK